MLRERRGRADADGGAVPGPDGDRDPVPELHA